MKFDKPFSTSGGLVLRRVLDPPTLTIEAHLEYVPVKMDAHGYALYKHRQHMENLRIHGVTTTKTDLQGVVTKTHEVELDNLKPDRNIGTDYDAYVKLYLSPDDVGKIRAWDNEARLSGKK